MIRRRRSPPVPCLPDSRAKTSTTNTRQQTHDTITYRSCSWSSPHRKSRRPACCWRSWLQSWCRDYRQPSTRSHRSFPDSQQDSSRSNDTTDRDSCVEQRRASCVNQIDARFVRIPRQSHARDPRTRVNTVVIYLKTDDRKSSLEVPPVSFSKCLRPGLVDRDVAPGRVASVATPGCRPDGVSHAPGRLRP